MVSNLHFSVGFSQEEAQVSLPELPLVSVSLSVSGSWALGHVSWAQRTLVPGAESPRAAGTPLCLDSPAPWLGISTPVRRAPPPPQLSPMLPGKGVQVGKAGVLPTRCLGNVPASGDLRQRVMGGKPLPCLATCLLCRLRSPVTTECSGVSELGSCPGLGLALAGPEHLLEALYFIHLPVTSSGHPACFWGSPSPSLPCASMFSLIWGSWDSACSRGEGGEKRGTGGPALAWA